MRVFRSSDLRVWEYLDTSDSVLVVGGGLMVTASVSPFNLHRCDPQSFFRLTVVEP